MPTVWIETPHSKVSLAGTRLIVEGPRPLEDGAFSSTRVKLRDIPLRDIDHVACREDVTVTTRALAEMLRRGIAVHLFSSKGRYLGCSLPQALPKGMERRRQYERSCEPDFCLRLAREIVSAKIYNQRRVLQRLAASRGERDPVVDRLTGFISRVQNTPSPESLLGVEGSASAGFYQAWARWLPEAFPFERRSRRPPQNPVNACLSYLSTLLYAEAVAAVHAVGLDPALGLFHATENGRWALALDLMEPFRPVIVESLTLDLLNRAILKMDDFEPAEGGIYLSSQGRKRLILHYEKRLGREFISEHTGQRTSIRRQLHWQAEAFRRTLNDDREMTPFRMN